MEYQATFDVSAPESEVNRRIATCLAQAGFVPVQGEPIRYKRGSLLSASFSFSPLKAPITLSVAATPCDPDSTQVYLLYDVSTTGATLDACARVLLAAGAAEVRALTAARVVSPRR